ncbi:MAG: FAD:protein FMN transferase [Salinivirgaceae bacterium]
MKRFYFFAFALIILLLNSCTEKASYIRNSGYIQGTTYHFIYESPNGKDYQLELDAELRRFDLSLSNYEPYSIISRMNRNDSDVLADELFETCFKKAMEISETTDGAFDITVGPLVNAWGFGFEKENKIDNSMIDSLMKLVGFHKVKLIDKKLIKEDPKIKIDVNAIAQGYSVDVIAMFLEKKKVKNYMVEIGGELRVQGLNDKGLLWRIGIDKPIEGSTERNRELQEIVSLNNLILSTSGNYRKFYEKDGIKYSHTINPKTGYPSKSNLLSASVAAADCMTADALSTAFMVMGTEKSIELVNQLKNIEVYFISIDSTNQYQVYASDGFKKMITD